MALDNDTRFLHPRADPSALAHEQEMPNQQGRALPDVSKTSTSLSSWWWWWEIAGATLSIFGILLVVVLLLKIDQTTLSSWILPIQPSSLLSVLTTISKTSVLVSITSCMGQLKWRHFSQRPRPLNHLQIFDDASRGPWGSSVMVSRLLFQEHIWAAVATGLAVCNVLALGIDPSAQQLIALEAQEVRVLNNSALVSRAGDYYSRAWDVSDIVSPGNAANLSLALPGVDILNIQERVKMDAKLQALPYNSIDKSPQPFYRCPEPALHCEWDNFSTLGVCGKFRNVTDSVRQNCTTAIFSDDGDFVRYTDGEEPNDSYYQGICDFWLDSPSNGTIDDIGDNHPIDPITLEFWNTPPDKEVRFGDVFYNVAVNTSSTLRSIWMVKVDNFTQSFNGTMYTTFESFISDFYWCHQELEGVTASDSGLKIRSKSTRPWASAEGDRFHNGVPNPDEVAAHSGGNESIGYNSETILPYVYNVQGEPTYRITKSIYGLMQTVVDSILGPKQYWDPHSGGTYGHYDSPNGAHTVSSGTFSSLLLYDDVEAYTNRLADAITAFVLVPKGDNINATMIPGYMIYNEPYFTVRWPWLFVLILEFFLAISLLAVTIFMTRGQPLLKNSIIALLACTLSGWKGEELKIASQETPEQWEEIAKRMVVQFSKDKEGLLRFNNNAP
ncbi:hypothetical protein E0Z10_g2825 [Xylaria hypoxylon]|uniref:Uncharacterized protein n=1 Tax=Xylaria hypoxylon TaxID=37992 RepID=A0A4Z0Z2I7_9PEZI|nr:hypothetical protein E0Z10_g2825 [Xylaria hypoxylon]